MRRKIVAGNWKMNGTLDDAIKLTSEIVEMYKDEINSDVQVVLSPLVLQLKLLHRIVQHRLPVLLQEKSQLQ